MSRLNLFFSSVALCAAVMTGQVHADTVSSLNSRMNLELSDSGKLTVKSSYLTYYLLRGRDPVTKNLADSPIFIKPVDGRLDGPSVSVNWSDSDHWYPSVDGAWPKFRFTDQAVDLDSLRYQGAKRDWKNTDLVVTGASLKDLFGKNSTFVQGDRADSIALIGLNSLRLVEIAGSTITKGANLDVDKSMPHIQKLAEAFRNAKDVVNGLVPYVAYAQVTLDYIQGLQTAMGSDAAALDPYIQSFDLLKDNMSFFTDNIDDKAMLLNSKKSVQYLFVKNIGRIYPEYVATAANAPLDEVVSKVQKDFAAKYKAATPEDKKVLLVQMTMEYFGGLLQLVDDDLSGRIEAEKNAAAKTSLEKQQTWLRRGKGAVNLIVLYASNKDLVDQIINVPSKLTPIMVDIGTMFMNELEGSVSLNKSIKGQIQALQDATVKAAGKAVENTPYMKAVSLGTQSGNVLIPFLWDAVLAESRLSSTIESGRFNPFGELKSTVYVTRTSARTGKVSHYTFNSDNLNGAMNVVADVGDTVKVEIAVQRPLLFSPERAPWLLNTGFPPQTLYQVSSNLGGSGGYMETRFCGRKIAGNLDYSVHRLTAMNAPDVPAVRGCGAGDLLGNDWFSRDPLPNNGFFTDFPMVYDNPDTLPEAYRLAGEPDAAHVLQSREGRISFADQKIMVDAQTYGSGYMHRYTIQVVPERAVTVTPAKTDITLGETVAITVSAAWDGVKSVVLTIGDKALELFENLGDAIQYVFDQAGDLLIGAEVRDAGNTVLGSGSSAVNVKAMSLGSISPGQVIRMTPGHFVLTGERVPARLRVTTAGGACGAPTDVSGTGFAIDCTFERIGEQILTVYNADTNQMVGTATVQVKTNVTAVKWANNNGAVKFGDTITYTVEGINLTGGMGFAVEKCVVSNTEVGTGTDLQRTFQCRFNNEAGAVAGPMPGVVKDRPDGQVLFNFTVPVEVDVQLDGDKLNDTGITSCWNNTTILGDCATANLGLWSDLNQDGQTGRDALAAKGRLTKVGGGSAGFDFTKIGPNGESLPADAPAWNCVRDNHTGLMWEVKTADGGLRDVGKTYTWYNPDSATNGGNPGFEKSGNNTYAFVNAVNKQSLCSHNDWRLPDRMELIGLVDYSQHDPEPTISASYFPHTMAAGSGYWTSSPWVVDFWEPRAWRVDFDSGKSEGGDKGGARYVRLVRSAR